MLPEQISSALQTLSTASPEELRPHSEEVLQVLGKLGQFLPVDNSEVAARRPSTLRAFPPSDVGVLIQESQAYLSLPRNTPEGSGSVQSPTSHQLNENIARSCVNESWTCGDNHPLSSRQPNPECSAPTDSSIERFLTDQPWIDLSGPTPSSHRGNVDNEIPPAGMDWTAVSTSQPNSHQNDQRAERSLLDLSWVDTSIMPDHRQSSSENGWPLLLSQVTRHDADPLPVSVSPDCPSILSLDTTCLSSTSVPDLSQDVSGNKKNQLGANTRIKERYFASSKLGEKVKLNKTVIEEYLKYPIDEAVGEPSSICDDIRLVDIECVDGQSAPTFQNVFRKILAHRSITIQYHGWCGSHQTNGQSRRLSRANFSRNGSFGNPKVIANALRYGLKLERVEKSAEFPTISILFCVGFWEFKQITEPEVARFIKQTKTSEPELWDLLKANARWFENCQTLYSENCKAINQGRVDAIGQKRRIGLCVERKRKRPLLSRPESSGHRTSQYGS